MKLDQNWQDALAKQGLTTALMARFDFRTESVFVWTGAYSFVPAGTGDALLDGNQFDPFINGALYQIGENTFSESGSDALDLTLSLPAILPDEFQSAAIDANEYLARPFTMWRALMVNQAGLATPATWLIRRVRSGVMDTLQFQSDGTQSTAKLTIGSHASYTSNASQSRYSDQKRFDPNDTSQDYEASVKNGQPIAPNVTSVITSQAALTKQVAKQLSR